MALPAVFARTGAALMPASIVAVIFDCGQREVNWGVG
jgi:hypothetical protein